MQRLGIRALGVWDLGLGGSGLWGVGFGALVLGVSTVSCLALI